MRVVYHQDVQSDVNQALERYRSISPQLAEMLWDELQANFTRIKKNPLACHFETAPFRRANLKRFPYAILYRVFSERVKIIVIKHVKRRSDFGLKRR
jgi:plasmid stabilization system protein ParE